MSVTRLTRKSGIPATTVLRFLRSLGDAGLVKRTNDPTDARRVFVALTAQGMEAMNSFFEASGSRVIFL
jgi:DNA-binding MarR family transcriptional regulator